MRASLVAGLDEAGRGSLVGPLAVAIVVVEGSAQAALREMGAKDSKLLRPARRRELAAEIAGAAVRAEAELVPSWAVDSFLRSSGSGTSLNSLEAAAFARLIASSCPDAAIVDSPDPRPLRFGELVSRLVSGMGCGSRVISRIYADETYPVVGAASIVAKVARDEEVARYARAYSEALGSGYPHDRRTLNSIRAWASAHGELPFFVRSGWATASSLGPRNL